jgi:hypothetical protein
MIKQRQLPTIHLTQKHFDYGTYRITQPGRYILQEDIVFHPNPEDGFAPTLKQNKEYPQAPGPYNLGFFAAITIETDHVELDLNHHTIQQSVEFYCRQRFFNIISLSSSPFIPTQGPGKFGPTIQSAKQCKIHNGTLGLSSHSGIHGNGAYQIIVENVTIQHFEVGGITLNGSQKVTLKDITIYQSLGTTLKVPFNGRFASAVFLIRAFQRAVAMGYGSEKVHTGPYVETVQSLLGWLKGLVDIAIRQVVDLGLQESFTPERFALTPRLAEAYYYFGNPHGKPDGSAVYGVLFNRIGIAVNEFGACSPDCEDAKNQSREILCQNVSISKLTLEPREVVGLPNSQKPGKFQVDFSGSLILISSGSWFQHQNNYQPETSFINENRPYAYDKILLSQVALFTLARDRSIKSLKGVAHLEKPVLDWVRQGDKPFRGKGTYRNTDIMAHVMKGAIGIRLDSVVQINLENVSVGDISNTGPLGICHDTGYGQELAGYLDGQSTSNQSRSGKPAHELNLGHPKSSDVELGYTGNNVRGISFIRVFHLRCRAVDVSRLVSTNGCVYGLDVMRYNKTHLYRQVSVSHLLAGNFNEDMTVPYQRPNCYRLPNTIQRCIGFLARMENSDIEIQQVSAQSLTSTERPEAVVLESACQVSRMTMPSQGKPIQLPYEINNSGQVQQRNIS